MTEAARKYLSDILGSIDLIESFVIDTQTYQEYVSDLKTQGAVERHLAIVGEALNKFGKEEPTFTFEHQKQIIAFRNRLVHAYDNIDASIVWAVLKNHLPKLKTEVESFITAQNQP